MSDIEGKAAKEAVSKCGQRANFNCVSGGSKVFDVGSACASHAGDRALALANFPFIFSAFL